jgi:predicted lipoprotein with Yx(FWY)xxD motif
MTIRTLSRVPVLAVAAAAAVGLSACGAPAGTGAPAAPTSAAPAAAAAAAPQAGTVLIANSIDKLGTVVVDGQGYTLYRFDKDTPKPPVSNCAGECAQKWPPVLATPGSPLTVEGVAEKAVGTINRPDGSIQLTLGGWPVYRYSGDTEPGAITGQGVSGTWAAVTPEGGKAAARAAGATPPAGASPAPAAPAAPAAPDAVEVEPQSSGY